MNPATPSTIPPDTTTYAGRSRLRRHPERGSQEQELIRAILDEALVCHVALVDDAFGPAGTPVVIPMACARQGDSLLLHGSHDSRLLRLMTDGRQVCAAVTLLDGLVLARSTLHHSMNYRSVVLFGQAEPIEDPEEKERALEVIVEHLVPGRGAEARPASPQEIAATAVVRLPIHEATAKVRSGPPKDSARDLELPVWAGVLPLGLRPGQPVADAHTPEGMPLPASVTPWRRPGT